MDNINVHFDKNIDLLWQEGFVKRYDGIYLFTSLLYLKSLERECRCRSEKIKIYECN